MASKRAFPGSISCVARFAAGSAPAIRPLVSRQQQQHLPISLPAASVRLAHGIPRPRNYQPPPTTAAPSQTPSSSSTNTPTATNPTIPNPNLNQPPANEQQTRPPDIRQQPHYELTFTCRPCGHRSRHRVSKHGYHRGSVLIACPGCRNRHVISDHLRIFGDAAVTVEDLLRQRGELVKRGTLGWGGGGEGEADVEFWEDGTVTVREEDWLEETTPARGGSSQREGEGEGVDPDAPPGASFKVVRPGERKEEV